MIQGKSILCLGLLLCSSLACLSIEDQVQLANGGGNFIAQFHTTLDMINANELTDLAWVLTEEDYRFENELAAILDEDCVDCYSVHEFIDETVEHIVEQVAYVEPEWERLVRGGDPVFVSISKLLTSLRTMKPSCTYKKLDTWEDNDSAPKAPEDMDQLLERLEEYAEELDDGAEYYWNPEDYEDYESDLNKIINGSRVTDVSRRWPFIVSAGGCTGSLITGNCVLSARHCGSSSSVRIGALTRSRGGFTRSVSRRVQHSSLDVHILVLRDRVSSSTPRVRVQGYSASTQSFSGRTGWAGGYGATSTSGSGGGTLREVQVRMTRASSTRIDVRPTGSGTGGPLWGDSGGPLLNSGVQVGTVRGGSGDGIRADYVNTEGLGRWITNTCG